nr:MAG TPA: hypothetical protein [Caudoviricetes sp.]
MKSYKCNFIMNKLIADKNHASKYHIESIDFFADPKLAPITDVREYYNDYEKAMMAAHILALIEAQEMNCANRETVGGENACWFEADDDNEDDGYDYIVRCWDGDDYRPVTKYKVVKDQ